MISAELWLQKHSSFQTQKLFQYITQKDLPASYHLTDQTIIIYVPWNPK